MGGWPLNILVIEAWGLRMSVFFCVWKYMYIHVCRNGLWLLISLNKVWVSLHSTKKTIQQKVKWIHCRFFLPFDRIIEQVAYYGTSIVSSCFDACEQRVVKLYTHWCFSLLLTPTMQFVGILVLLVAQIFARYYMNVWRMNVWKPP